MQINMDHVKTGISGNWAIEDFVVPPNDFSQTISMWKSGRGVPPGTYKRLIRGHTVVMSNTPDEIRDFMPFVRKASGSVLINGLGLGVVVTALLQKDSISAITVVEKAPEVIQLVASSFNDPRLTIINADAFEYMPPKGAKYNAVWHDIWDYICTDNLPQMAKLHLKYARKAYWQGSWAKDLCLAQKRRNNVYF